MKTSVLPIAKRPGEYVAFFSVKMRTKEGPAFVYFGVDAYSAFAFHLGVDRDERPETVLKFVYVLTEDPQFVRHRDKGFTLVVEKYHEFSDRINAIISGVNGKLLVNPVLAHKISLPVLESLRDFFLPIRDDFGRKI